jgi:NAD(P)-dependent dehydrogenase (short-subunit alcohol dehydrogenase family)
VFSDLHPPEHTFKVFSAQGIGKAIALRLADDGFDVAVNDIPKNSDNLLEVVKEIKAKGRASSAHLADVSVEDEVKAMVADVVQVYHALDVVRPIVDMKCK